MSTAAEAAKAAAAAAATPGISPDMLAFIQMRKDERAEERADKIAQERRHEHQMEMMRRQCEDTIKMFASKNTEKAKPPTAKLPVFDIESDPEHFNLWKDRWEIHIKAHRIHLIEDEDENLKRDRR